MADSIVRRLLNKGKVVRNIEEPWWSRQAGNIAESAIKAHKEHEKEKVSRFNRELQTLSSFESRLGNKLNNYIASGDIYNEAEMPKLKESINNFYDQYSSKFPELISEFSEERESILGRVDSYSAKNKQKDTLLSKIDPTKKKLFSIVETLNTTATADFTPDDRVKFRQEIYDTMEDITKLDKLIDDPYYAGIDGWADTIEDVKYGLSDASKQLITQINTWDSEKNVISGQDLDNLENAIFKNDTQGIRAVNEQIVTDKAARTKQYETDYNTYLKNYATISSFSNAQQYKKLKKDKEDAYDRLDKKGKINADNDPMYWFEYPMGDIPGMPEEGVNLQNVDAQLIKLKTEAENIDANYRNEHITGASIAEVLNKPLPWAKQRKSLEQKRIEHEKRVKAITPSGKLPDISGITSPTGDEPFAVSELHKPVTPEEPTMPTGEPRAFSEMNNPGNLRFADQKDSTGKTAAGFATFGTPDAGWQALYNQIDLDKTRNFTLEEFTNKYAPPSENDTTAYITSLQKQLKVNKSTKIEDINTKKLANAIAKQEGWKGEFPSIETKAKGLKVDSPLTKVKDNKVVVNYSSASPTGFLRQQTNLNKIASQKYNTKENKSKHKNIRDFVKSKFEEWLRSTGKYGKYAEGDFKYFIPTKVDRKNQINPNWDMNIYNLYYPGAFSGAEGDARMMIKPKIGSGYLGFAKDFDEFREFLQES